MRSSVALPIVVFAFLHGNRQSGVPPSDFAAAPHVVFQDDFRADKAGEAPSRWKLVSGHAEVALFDGAPALALIEGRDVRVAPIVPSSGDSYLTDSFTVELDSYPKQGSFGGVSLYLAAGDDERQIAFGEIVATNGFEHERSGMNPGGAQGYMDRWHHVALAFRNGELRCYSDRLLMLTMPDVAGFQPRMLSLGTRGHPDAPVYIRNVRIATAGAAKGN